MKIRKLSAITSTNDYLKELASKTALLNYTIVVTDFQTKGKGQLYNSWHSEAGKNLLFSVLIRFEFVKIKSQTFLNFAISNAIFEVLDSYLPFIKIKWPNDIMSHKNKICGILIENVVKNDIIKHSIVGIGLNINQIIFPKELKNVTSLKIELLKSFDRDTLLEKIIKAIKKQVVLFENKQFDELKSSYIKNLYKVNKPAMFKRSNNTIFLGKIINITNTGKLIIELDTGKLEEFSVKEITFLH